VAAAIIFGSRKPTAQAASLSVATVQHRVS
jgi:hypothetical protein